MYLSIISNKDTYESNDRSIYGELFIVIDDLTFPGEGWIDIISSVLDMWIDNMINLLQSNLNNDEKELYFMDGPYYFKVNRFSDEMVKVTLFDHDKQINNEPYEISFYNLLSEIYNLINEIILDKQLRRIKDVKKLQRKYKFLKKILKR